MRKIKAEQIKDILAGLAIEANTSLRKDVLDSLKLAFRREKNANARDVLAAIIENAMIAKKDKLAICQDTGLPFVFVEMGDDLQIIGDLKSAINQGVELGYRKGYLRNSVIRDPLSRGKPVYSPSLIHIDIVKGDKLKITLLPKGFGCENKSQLVMLKPTDGLSQIRDFVLKTVKQVGPDACPPFVIGVGIGGSADYASVLAKKALLKKIDLKHSKNTGKKSKVDKLERELLSEINKLNIGAMGFGGQTTCLGVNILTAPTHIAGLPVAINISCHALRSASKTI